MRSLIVGLLILFASLESAQAAPLPPAAAVQGEQLLTGLKQGHVAEAFHGAFRDIEGSLGSNTIDNLAAQTTGILKSLGDIVDWSDYETDEITSTLLRHTYFVRCSSVPMFVTVQFYYVSGVWRIIDIQLNSYDKGRTAGYYGELGAARSQPASRQPAALLSRD
jgi:hypothetical protein